MDRGARSLNVDRGAGLIGWLAVAVLLLAAGAVGYTIFQSERRPEGSVDQFLHRPRPTGKRVAVIFGASTIHGRVGVDALPAVRSRLPAWEIVNAGHNGDTCARLLARVEPVLACKPEAVVVETGGNDALQDKSAKDFARDLAALIDRLELSVTHLALCSFQVTGDDPTTPLNRRLGEYTEVLHALATERKLGYLRLRERMIEELEDHPGGAAWNAKLGMVLGSMLERHILRRSVDEQSRRRGFMFNPDGLHLNTRGSMLLADVIVEYLETVA